MDGWIEGRIERYFTKEIQGNDNCINQEVDIWMFTEQFYMFKFFYKKTSEKTLRIGQK